MSARLARLQGDLGEALLVSNPVNVQYLTGFHSSNAALLVEQDRVRLFSDFRYAAAGRAIAGVEFVETGRSLFADLAALLSGTVAFEPEHLSYARYQALARKGVELVPAGGPVERLRAVKDEVELRAIRHAAEITSTVFERLADEPFVGRSEQDLAWRLRELMQELGADGTAFDPAVAAGPAGAVPHAEPTRRPIETGQTVVIDVGAQVEGYFSDCTRTFATPGLSVELREAYEVCRSAQAAGLAAVAVGVHGKDADCAARELIDQSPFAGAFGHGLGHGVGLQIHEAPVLRPGSDDELSAGNVVTVEPGIYLEGRGGIRIEDLVVVGPAGPDVLTSFTKELVEVR